MPTPASQFDSPRSTADAWLQGAGLLAIAAAALWLRTHQTSAPFTSADHIMIAYRTTCEPGWRWCFQNHYGPLQPLVTKVFSLAVTGLGMPMTETLWRLPMGIVGAVIPILAFALARRVGGVALPSGLMLGSDAREIRTANERPLTVPPTAAAWVAAIWTAVLPPLVTDARYMWAYETLGAALALAVMIATFAYMDRSTRGRAWVTGILLALYLQSHLHVYAVPCVVLFVLLFDKSIGEHGPEGPCAVVFFRWRGGTAGRLKRLMATPGLWLPPLISLCVLIAAWRLVGGGPIARIIAKSSAAAASTDRLSAAASLARAWLGHIGWPAAVLVAITLVLPRIVRLLRPGHASSVAAPRRTWFLGAWIILFAAPLFILGFRTGRPTQYLTQATTVAAILTSVVIFSRRRDDTALPAWRRAACTMVAGLLYLGAYDANFPAGRFSQQTGVTAAWGAALPNAGYKTAGWYIRKHVPADAVVFALHDISGLERPVAEYYFGRACIAGEDLMPAQSFALSEHFLSRVDVIVDDLRVPGERPQSWMRDFARAALIRDGHRPLVRILVRGTPDSQPIELEVSDQDSRYDAEYGPRTLGRAPPVPARMPDSPAIREFLRALK